MRICIVAALLFGGCGVVEVDEEFVEEVDSYYFGSIEDGRLALGAKADEGSMITLRLRETNEDGLTPARLCLRGKIKVPLGTLRRDCIREPIQILETARFTQGFQVKPGITVQVRGDFAEDRQALDLSVQHVGSITLTRCNFVQETRMIQEADSDIPTEEVVTILDSSCRSHF